MLARGRAGIVQPRQVGGERGGAARRKAPAVAAQRSDETLQPARATGAGAASSSSSRSEPADGAAQRTPVSGLAWRATVSPARTVSHLPEPCTPGYALALASCPAPQRRRRPQPARGEEQQQPRGQPGLRAVRRWPKPAQQSAQSPDKAARCTSTITKKTKPAASPWCVAAAAVCCEEVVS